MMRPLNSDSRAPFSQENTDEPDEYSEGSGSLKGKTSKDIKRTYGYCNVFYDRYNRIMKSFKSMKRRRMPAACWQVILPA